MIKSLFLSEDLMQSKEEEKVNNNFDLIQAQILQNSAGNLCCLVKYESHQPKYNSEIVKSIVLKPNLPDYQKRMKNISEIKFEKSRIRETKNLSTDADSRTDTIMERFSDLKNKKLIRGCVIYLIFFFLRERERLHDFSQKNN